MKRASGLYIRNRGLPLWLFGSLLLNLCPATAVASWSWAPVAGGIPGKVNSMQVYQIGPGPALYVGAYDGVLQWDGYVMAYVDTPAVLSTNAMCGFDRGTGPALYYATDYSEIWRWDGQHGTSIGFGTGGLPSWVFALSGVSPGGPLGGKLFAGGHFDAVSGQPVGYGIAQWDGSAWSSVGGGVGPYGYHPVRALCNWAGSLWVGGEFYEAGGASAPHIARWDGDAWSPVGDGLPAEVRALTAFDDGAGSALYAAAGTNVFRWDGGAWDVLGTAPGNWVTALSVFDDGSGPALYAAAGGTVAKWTGTSWMPLGSQFDGGVYSLATFRYGETASALYAGGNFHHVGNVSADYLAVWIPEPGAAAALAILLVLGRPGRR